MQLYAWAGKRGAALRQYQECRRVLEREVEAPPMRATTDLFEALKAGRTPPPPVRWPVDSGKAAVHVAPQNGPNAVGAGKEINRPAASVAGPAPAHLQANEEYRIATVLFLEIAAKEARLHTGNEDESEGFVDLAAAVLTRYGGRIERVKGNQLTVVFGTTRIRESDPELAVRAALDVRKEGQKLGLGIAAGISTGGICLSSLGAKDGEQHPGPAWSGSVVTLARRLCGVGATAATVDAVGAAAEGVAANYILAGETTYRLTRKAIGYIPVSIRTKGQARTIIAYRPKGALIEPKKARGIEGLMAELIGREEELGKLQTALSEIFVGSGRIVSLIGEAGVGKSRLVAELKAAIHRRDASGRRAGLQQADSEQILPSVTWLEGRCLELAVAASYWPFIDIFKEYFAWREDEEEDLRSTRIVAALNDMVQRADLSTERLQEIGPLLGNLLSARFNNEWNLAVEKVDPDTKRYRTFTAVRDFLIALAKRRPLVLVFEDLHWADHLSLDLISFLMEVLPRTALFLLCVYRPESNHKSRQIATVAMRKCPDRYLELYLRELTPRQSRRMIESLLHIENLPRSMKAMILKTSQGNPFFVEEVIRSLIDSEMVFQAGKTWRAVGC